MVAKKVTKKKPAKKRKPVKKSPTKKLKKSPAKKKKSKKGHYHTGTYNSSKCDRPIKYKSNWEKIVCEYLDWNPEVSSYEYESVVIPYITNKRSNRIRKYFPDLLVKFTNNTTKMIEVKPLRKTTNALVMKKAEAARIWCEKRGMTYEFWTENEIKQFKKLMKDSLVENDK